LVDAGATHYHGCMPSSRGVVVAPLLKWAGKLRFPRLFALAAALFLVDLLVPDLIPFADEILLGLATLLLGGLRERRNGEAESRSGAAAPPS